MQDYNKSSILALESYTPPQVYSPLPMRTPVVSCVDLGLNLISNNEISLVDREELCNTKFKSFKFLFNQINDSNLNGFDTR